MPDNSLNDPRLTQLAEWLSGLQTPATIAASLRPASADASFRRYFRVDTPDGQSLIVMDAPPPQEDVRPFVKVAELFSATGVSVPTILAQDTERGFLLLSDLGSTTYLQQLNPDTAHKLYIDAIDALILLQVQSRAGVLPAYDRELLHRELMLFPDWYITRHLKATLTDAQTADLNRVFDVLLANNLAQAPVYVHRDYHSRNLMVMNKGNPGILDFQDAVYGPITYDLVSLLRDAYIQWDEELVLDWVIRYWERARRAGLPVSHDVDAFYRDFEFMGLQRHLKVLGIFARLYHRDGKDGYLNDMPLVMEYTRKTAYRYKEFAPLIRLLDTLQENTTGVGFTF
jgi:aminoglycoside/choline kinase family phosphotransferase